MTAKRYGTRLSTVPKEKVRWWSKGRLAFGKLHIVEGNGGVGKSTLLMEWAARATTGEALPDGEPFDPMGVGILTQEDGAGDTIRPRLEAAGGNPDKVWLLDEIPVSDPDDEDAMVTFALPTHIALLEEAVRINNIGLVIIDPFADFLEDDLSENSNKDVRKALGPLAKMAERTGTIVVVIRHLSKNIATNALTRGAGSVGILAKARIGLLVEEDPRDSEIKCIARNKGNLGKKPATLQFRIVDVPQLEVGRVDWQGVSDLTADDLLAGKIVGVDQMAEWDEATEWLQDYLADGAKELQHMQRDAAAMKISKESLRKAQTRLRARNKKAGFGGKWLVELPYQPPLMSNGHKTAEEVF